MAKLTLEQLAFVKAGILLRVSWKDLWPDWFLTKTTVRDEESNLARDLCERVVKLQFNADFDSSH